jgi:hypothetical protein
MSLIFSKVCLKKKWFLDYLYMQSKGSVNITDIQNLDSTLNNFSKKKMAELFRNKHFVNLFELYLRALHDGSYVCNIQDYA